jgi:excisionase family DNA binding protein
LRSGHSPCSEGSYHRKEFPVTVKEAAEKLEVSVSLVYQLIADARLPHHRIGGRGRRGKIVIQNEDIQAFLASCRVGSEIE